MAEKLNITRSSGASQTQESVTKKQEREPGEGPFSLLRTRNALVAGGVVIAVVLVVILFGAFARPVKSLDRQDQLRREKALRDRDEAPHESEMQAAPADSGQPATKTTD